MKTAVVLAFLLTLPLTLVNGDVKLPSIISEHMVLKKDARVPIWGKAEAGEKVTVKMNGQTLSTSANAEGKWSVIFDLSNSSSGPFEMTVAGNNTITISDVVIGEVWLASGQSNMEWPLRDTNNAKEEIAASGNPFLRQFRVAKTQAEEPQDDCKGRWELADPRTTPSFTATGYYFGKELQQELKVPVGIINSSFGATHSEMWTSRKAIDTDPELKATVDRYFHLLSDYPTRKANWLADFGKWLETSKREDKPTENTALFTSEAATDWITVTNLKKLNLVKMEEYGLPEYGAIWFRTEVEIPSDKANVPQRLYMPYLDGFETIYWNGEPLYTFTFKNHPGRFELRRGEDYGSLNHVIPTEKLKPGKNTLAVRIFAPATPAIFPLALKVNGADHAGAWLGKTEYTLPPPSADALPPKAPENPPAGARQTSHLFNAMINPITQYAISGVIWYQGEANTPRGYQYRTSFPLLINDWRDHWQRGDIPFLFCQLASMNLKGDSDNSRWAELREAQSMALRLPNTGQVVLVDFNDGGNLHPRNKKDVGHRLALIALAKTYGKKVAWSGPLFNKLEIEGGKARIHFTHLEGGLVAKPVPATATDDSTGAVVPVVRNSPTSELEGFAICGADQKWVWADARIDGETIIVSSKQMAEPVAVRYGWADNPTMNLYNAAGLPAAPFRTDDFPRISRQVKY